MSGEPGRRNWKHGERRGGSSSQPHRLRLGWKLGRGRKAGVNLQGARGHFCLQGNVKGTWRGSQSFRSPRIVRPGLLEAGLQERIFARGCDLWRALAPPRRSATAFALIETSAWDTGTVPQPAPSTPTCSLGPSQAPPLGSRL